MSEGFKRRQDDLSKDFINKMRACGRSSWKGTAGCRFSFLLPRGAAELFVNASNSVRLASKNRPETHREKRSRCCWSLTGQRTIRRHPRAQCSPAAGLGYGRLSGVGGFEMNKRKSEVVFVKVHFHIVISQDRKLYYKIMKLIESVRFVTKQRHFG